MSKGKTPVETDKESKKAPILCRASKRTIVTGSERRDDGIRITRQGLSPITTEELAAEIQHGSSLTRGDVIHVLTELQDIMAKCLRKGQMVCLDKIGSFDLSIGTTQPMYGTRDIHDSDIVAKGITFRPTEALLKGLEGIKFHVIADTRSIISERSSIPLIRDWFDNHDVITMLNYATMCHCSRTTARRRINNLLATHRLERLPHSTTCYVPGVNLYSTNRP